MTTTFPAENGFVRIDTIVERLLRVTTTAEHAVDRPLEEQPRSIRTAVLA